MNNSEKRIIEKEQNEYKYLQEYGGIDNCLELLEHEKRPVKLLKLVKVIDKELDSDSSMDLNTYMRNAVKHEDDKTLITLSGYSHLLLAERMYNLKYCKRDINKEIDKSCALLDLANRGGNHPYLPRAVKLKRKVNCASYTRLVLIVIFISFMILFIAWLSRYLYDNSDLFL